MNIIIIFTTMPLDMLGRFGHECMYLAFWVLWSQKVRNLVTVNEKSREKYDPSSICI